MKKIIIMSLTIILSISLLTGCGKKNTNSDNQTDNNQNKEEKENKNISANTNVIGSQTIGSLTFEIKALKYENEVSTLEYLITNNSQIEVMIPLYKVMISDDGGVRYEYDINHKNNILDSNKTLKIKKEIKKDLTKATSIKFELVEE